MTLSRHQAYDIDSGGRHFAAFMRPDEFLRKLLVDVRPLADRRNLIAIEQA